MLKYSQHNSIGIFFAANESPSMRSFFKAHKMFLSSRIVNFLEGPLKMLLVHWSFYSDKLFDT